MWCFSTPFSPGFFCGIAWAGEGGEGDLLLHCSSARVCKHGAPSLLLLRQYTAAAQAANQRCVLYNGPAVQFQLPEQKFPTKQLAPPSHRGIGKRTCHYREDPKRGENPCLINSCHFYWRPMLAWHQDKGTFAAALQGPPNDALPFHPLFLLFFS